MYKYSKDGISILCILDTRRAKKSGLFPIKIQVVYKRTQKYYTTGKELSQTDWDKLPESKSRQFIDIRTDIQNSFEKIKEVVQDLDSQSEFSFDTLNNRLSKGDITTLDTFITNKIAALRNNEQIGTAMFYENTLQSMRQYAGENILITAITPEWLSKYEKHMLKLDRSYTTIGMYARAIRTMLNEAKKAGIIKESQYPFGKGKYEIPASESRKLALTIQQINQVVTFTDGNEATEKYRDLWFFSYLCNGINFTDILRLKYANIQNGEIAFTRAKTIRTSKVKKELYAIITPEIQAIIDRWGNDDKSLGSYIFPYLNGDETPEEEKNRIKDVVRRCNKKMKIIGESIGINGISTYTARHSYATVLKRSGANIAYISESLGHNDLKTTENYLASFEREEREKNAKLLTNFD